MIWCIKTYIIAYVKIQKNEDILSIMSNLQPNCYLKVDFQKVDQHAGGILTQDDSDFADDISKFIFLYENNHILIQISKGSE